jgi:hypothetical protein
MLLQVAESKVTNLGRTYVNFSQLYCRHLGTLHTSQEYMFQLMA